MHWFDPDYARKCCYQTNKLDVESLRENIPSSLETEMTWWWAWSPGPTGGTPGTWSQRSPRLCSTAKNLGVVAAHWSWTRGGRRPPHQAWGSGRHCLNCSRNLGTTLLTRLSCQLREMTTSFGTPWGWTQVKRRHGTQRAWCWQGDSSTLSAPAQGESGVGQVSLPHCLL